jgi:protein O-GlcNAc transferase
LSAMDYRLTDEQSDPPGVSDRFYTERLIRLPGSFFCYQPPDDAPEVNSLPAAESGRVTFGCFNSASKITPAAMEAWLEVLARLPGSRLLVLGNRGGHLETRLHQLARRQDVDPARIELHERLPNQEYMRLLGSADIGLDSFPFNGHTTTCDSIWMGLPVVMLEGDTYASRFGGSVLANLGLEHLMTRGIETYIDVAVNLASDLDALAHLRGALRPRMAASVLLDFEGFTRNLESEYRTMWRRWCANPQR